MSILKQSFEQVPSEWSNIKISMWHPLLLAFAAIIFRSYHPLYHSWFVRFPVLVGRNSHVRSFAQAPNDPIAIYPHLLSLLKTYIFFKKNMFFLLSSRYFLALLQLQSTFWILLDHSSIFFIILHQCSPSSMSSCSNILFHHFCRSYPMTRWPSPFRNTPCRRGRPWPASVKRWSVDPWSSWRHPISPRASKGLKNLTENSRNCSALEALDN